MHDPDRHFDPDPRPRRSPRLYARMEAVPGSVPTSSIRQSKPTPGQVARLRRDLAIYAMVESGMSYRMIAKVVGLTAPGILKAYRRISCHKSRV